MFDNARDHFKTTLAEIEAAGLYKHERVISSAQGASIDVHGDQVLNFCANNYLGLSSHPDVVAAAGDALQDRGFGMSSVRFICGTLDRHRELEQAISTYLGTDDTILYSSCFDANGGLFETLLGPEDAIISDALNHASIIDGIRLCKAKRLRYANRDLQELEAHLQATQDARMRLIATDGVFSMDGTIAPLAEICDLADKYGAMVMVDDSHATGFIGTTGRGTHEHCDAMGRVDIITSTLGKALGGASGGFTSARQEIVDLLRNRSRPYLFSNSLAPMIVAASLSVMRMISDSTTLRDTLEHNTKRFRAGIEGAGFTVKPGDTPIVPIMLGDARLATELADALLKDKIYVIGFSYPVVPKGQARIRVQLSAAHTDAQIDHAIQAFTDRGRELGILSA